MNEFQFTDLILGQVESIVVDVRQSEVDTFMTLSGDNSTVHVDDAYAASRNFEQRIVHGALVAAYISQLIGMKLPGKHGVLRSLNCEFRQPCYVPNRLIISGKISRLVKPIRLVCVTVEVKSNSGALLVTAKAESVLKA